MIFLIKSKIKKTKQKKKLSIVRPNQIEWACMPALFKKKNVIGGQHVYPNILKKKISRQHVVLYSLDSGLIVVTKKIEFVLF